MDLHRTPPRLPIWALLLANLVAFTVSGSPRRATQPAASPGVRPPNLLLIIADDVGTDSLRLFNGDSRASLPPTPHIDSLHQSGVLFRNAYGYPTCSPTRSTILTGRYGFRTGIGYALADPNEPVLQASEWTLPEILTAQPNLGYRHANIGKWHLSFGAADPNQLGGWNHFGGVLIGALPSYEVWPKTVNGQTTPAYRGYATTDNVNDALAWIGQQGTQPWLLWMAFNAAHTPYHKPDDSLHGYDRLPSSPIAVQANPRPYFEAMVEALDTEIGRLLAGVNRTNTTIVFLGDNGTLHTVIQPPYPMERSKGTLYQGGIRVPLIVSGPSVVRPHRDSSHLVHTVDLYATLLQLAGADPAAIVPSGHPIDSRSLVPILRDEEFTPAEDTVLTENFSATLTPDVAGRAALDGRHKLIQFDSGIAAFFDLASDPIETNNLLSAGITLTTEQQAVHDRLAAKLASWTNAVARVVISGWQTGTNGFSVAVTSSTIQSHRLQRASTPAGADWATVGEVAHGTAATLADPNPPGSVAFYRVLSQPLPTSATASRRPRWLR